LGRCAVEGAPLEPKSVGRLATLADAHFAEVRRRGIAYSLATEVSRRVWTDLYREFLRREGVPADRLHDLTERVYADFLAPANYRLFDDALPTLEACRDRGFRVGIVSNWEAWLPDLLRHLEIDHLLDFAVISGLVGREKPDIGIYAAAVEAAGVRAAELLHVGDSLSGDVHAARAAGLQAVLLDRTGRYPDARSPRVTSLGELLGWPELQGAVGDG
jgi:putative hydrolase of the HAD superfamily